MKIDLTKEEWEFLKDFLPTYEEFYYATNSSLKALSSILEKLGSEWVDDETSK